MKLITDAMNARCCTKIKRWQKNAKAGARSTKAAIWN